MKTIYFIAALFVFAASTVSSQEKKADIQTPPVEFAAADSGRAILTPDALADGQLLLFDGISFFGWSAAPLRETAPADKAKATVKIQNGEMTVASQTPIEIKTRLLLPRPWRIELTYRADPETKAFAAVHDATSNMYLKKFSFPLAETEASAKLTVEGRGEPGSEIFFNGEQVAPGATVDGGTGLAIVVERGKVVIESVIFRPQGYPLTEWKPTGDVKSEISGDAVHLTGGSGALESVGEYDDFYLRLEYQENVSPNNSGLFFRTIPGSKMDGYEAQLNNAPPESDRAKFLGNDTGSIFRRAAARRLVDRPSDWNALTVMAEADFFRTWVNGVPALVWTDTRPADENPRKGRRFKRGTIQLQGHDEKTDITFRKIFLADGKPNPNAAPAETPAPADENAAFESFRPFYEKLREKGVTLTDWHIHLRGGMTPEKALEREKATGIKSAVLENAGRDWPLSDDAKINAMIDAVKKASSDLPVGLQVNDRDWFTAISPETLKRLDFILADTMIMGVGDDGHPQKLWLLPKDYSADPDEWMARYMEHNLQILGEPITILANPTYLPAFLADKYDELWTDERMAQIIDKAVERGIALEIQAESPYPSERFLRMAIEKGAKLSFGTNNFDATLKNLSAWQKALETEGISPERFYFRKRSTRRRPPLISGFISESVQPGAGRRLLAVLFSKRWV